MPLTRELTKFTTTGELPLASYEWTDIIDGTGQVGFYFAQTRTNETDDYILTTKDFYSHTIEDVASGAVQAYTTKVDHDYDLAPFNKPQVIEGKGYIEFSYLRTAPDSGTIIDIDFKVRKWNSTTSTETEIVTIQGVRKSNEVAGIETYLNEFTMPRTSFSKGEQLRVTLVISTGCDTSQNVICAIGTDPKNRDGTYINPSTDDPETITKTKIYFPFRIED